MQRRDGGWIGAAILVGLLSLALPIGPQYVARALMWLVASAAGLAFATRRRPEPAASWQVMAVGNALIAAAWLARAIDADLRQLGDWPDLPAGAGLFFLGVGLLLAGRSRRERVALFDGAILAGAVLTFVWAALIVPEITPMTTDAQLGGAALHVAGGTLAVSVGVAIALSGRAELNRSTFLSTVGVLAVLAASVGWGWQGVRAASQASPGAAAWIVAPLLGAAVAATPERDRPERPVPTGLMTPARFGLLVLLTLMPSLTVGILSLDAEAGDAPTSLGLWVTSVSVVLLAARIRVSAGFAVEDEREATIVRHQRLIEHSADMVALISPAGTVFYASPSITRILGIDTTVLVDQPFAMIVRADERDVFASALVRASALPGSPLPVRLDLLASDGNALPTEGTVTDLTDVDGVDGIVITLRDVSERVALEEELRRAALEDPLTGLANRTLLTDRTRHALTQRIDGRSRVGFLYLDIDDFKTINDGLGHHAGDHVLQVVAERLRDVIREADTPGRLGGDEFAILLEGLDPDDAVGAAMVVAKRLLGRMEEPIEVAGESVRVRASMGLALGAGTMTVDELVQNADIAMYSAKKQGNDIELYDERMETRARRRLLLTQDLEAAIRADAIWLGYQPIVDLETKRMTSVEALLRWDHPRLGRIQASEMEDLAVRGGLADDLTRWVFARVQADRDTWEEQFGEPLVVAVNLAAQQLSGDVVRLFEESFGDRLMGREPGIQVELTESALLLDAKRAATTLGELRDRGATIAIDDFGTGYASLSYLRRLPVDVLKIDREFISELDEQNMKGSYAELIRDLARTLDLLTVAEGIETEAQRRAALALGCERGQGWLFGRAVPIGDLALDRALRDGGAIRTP